MIFAAEILGLGLLVTGVMMMSIPAGLIVLGASIVLLALAYERARVFAEGSAE